MGHSPRCGPAPLNAEAEESSNWVQTRAGQGKASRLRPPPCHRARRRPSRGLLADEAVQRVADGGLAYQARGQQQEGSRLQEVSWRQKRKQRVVQRSAVEVHDGWRGLWRAAKRKADQSLSRHTVRACRPCLQTSTHVDFLNPFTCSSPQQSRSETLSCPPVVLPANQQVARLVFTPSGRPSFGTVRTVPFLLLNRSSQAALADLTLTFLSSVPLSAKFIGPGIVGEWRKGPAIGRTARTVG